MTFKAFLLSRAKRDEHRDWFKRRATHDVCAEFLADCELDPLARNGHGLPPCVPDGDDEVYSYLDQLVGEITLPDGETKVLDYLWQQWKRKQR
jgi:hypothetical protein